MTNKKKDGKLKKSRIRSLVRKYVKRHGKAPESVLYFCNEFDLDSDQFYRKYESIDAVESDIWVRYFKKTYESMTSQEVYGEYSAREKLLSFYYTLLEILKDDITYAKWRLSQWEFYEFNPKVLRDFRELFLQTVEGMIAEGIETGEVEARWVLGDKYAKMHSHQLKYVLRYWASDESEESQHTDEAVEKAVNLGFDLMGKNVLDSAVDFVKFCFQK